jgi:hypothetical protein
MRNGRKSSPPPPRVVGVCARRTRVSVRSRLRRMSSQLCGTTRARSPASASRDEHFWRKLGFCRFACEVGELAPIPDSDAMRMIPPPERLPGLSRFVIADPPPATWSITSRRGCDQRVETSLSPDRADLQNPLVVEPMVGFRTWRLEGGRLRSPHHPMPDPWPLCATHAVCAATKTGGPACRALPTVDRGCGCGLHGEYEVTDLSEADVWGAVLAWGNLVLSDQGFRSEWQRPILLAAPQPGHLPPMALQGAASAYGAGVVAIGQLESAARKYGTPAPAVIVPITPLFLLSMYARQPEPPYPQTFRKLIDRIVMGSIAARTSRVRRVV